MEIKRIKNMLSDLNTKLTVYNGLYGSEESIKKLNSYSGTIFGILQLALIDSIFIGIARLMDPAKQGSNENLTIEYLVKHNSLEQDENVSKALGLAKPLYEASNIKVYRNKMLAHSDLSATLGALSISTNITSEKAIKLWEAMYNVVSWVELRLGLTDVKQKLLFGTILPRNGDVNQFLLNLPKVRP